jgi:hypothetical protein
VSGSRVFAAFVPVSAASTPVPIIATSRPTSVAIVFRSAPTSNARSINSSGVVKSQSAYRAQ